MTTRAFLQTRTESSHVLRPTWPLWGFSFLIVALSFKQLRMGGFAGPTEWLTVLAAMALIIHGVHRGKLLNNHYILGGTLVFTALSLGGVWAVIVEPERISLREAAAYAFAFIVVIAFFMLAWRRETTALSILAIVIAVYLATVLMLAFVPNPLRAAMWYYERRLQGLSDNPNQLALLAIVALLLFALSEIRRAIGRAVAVPLALCCAIAGILSESAAFIATLGAAALVLSVVAIIPHLSRSRGGDLWNGRRPVAFGLACLVVLANFAYEHRDAIVTFSAMNLSSVDDLMEADSRQGSVRVELWKQALEVGAQSPLVGLGPGYHLNPDTPALPQEAHNTVLDLFLVSGLAGVLALVAISGLALWGARRNDHLSIVLIIGIATLTFAMFHHIGRQPLFWIMVFAIIFLAGPHSFPRQEVRS